MSKIIDGIVKDLKSLPEKLKAKMGNVDKKELLLMNLPYVLAGYFCDKIAWLWRISPGQDASAKMIEVMEGLEDLFSNPLPSFYPKDLLVGVGCGIAWQSIIAVSKSYPAAKASPLLPPPLTGRGRKSQTSLTE